MKSFAIFSTFLLIGCANLTPALVNIEFPFAPELVEKIQKNASRAPASLDVTDVEGKSSRRVYFTALYYQYLMVGQHLNIVSDVNYCPQFHHDKIETDSAFIPKFSIYQSSTVNSDSKEFFPELVFNKNFSIKDYHLEIRQEIEALCEEGLSDNYYKFDNLITHYASKLSFHHRPDSMRSVLKIPVFANYYLLKMLQSPKDLSFVHPEEKKVFIMTQTYWFEKYVTEASRKRINLIKNRMVQK